MKVLCPALKAALPLCFGGILAALLNCSAPPEEPADAQTPGAAARLQHGKAGPLHTFELPSAGQVQERKLEKSQQHLYPLKLAKGDYLHLCIEQIEADVALALLDPESSPLYEVDTPDDIQVIESIRFVADRPGGYRLSLQPAHPLSFGRYRLWVEDLRPAQELDREVWAAFQLMTEAQGQFRQGSSESLRMALESYREAIDLWAKAGRRHEQGSALKQRGMALQRQGEKSQEMVHYQQALQLFRELGDQVQVVDLLLLIGGIHSYRGEPGKAIRAWREALGIAERTDNAAGKASLLNSLGVYYRKQGQISLALLHYGQALELNQLLGRRLSEAFVRENRGYLHMEAGDYPQSLDDLNKALEIFEQFERPADQAFSLTQMGLVRFQQKEFRQAVQLYERAIEVRRDLQDEVWKASVLINLGAAYGALNQPEKAIENYLLSLEALRGDDHRLTRATVLAHLGELHLNVGQPGPAQSYLSQAADLFSGSQQPGPQAHVQYLYAKAERSFGRLATAKDLTEKVLATVEGLRRNSPGRSLRADFWASRYDYIEFYIDLLMQMDEHYPDAGYDVDAFEASQGGRARGLYEALSIVGTAKRPINPDELERRNALNEQIRDLVQDSNAFSEPGDPVESRLRELMLQRDLLQFEYADSPSPSAVPLPEPALIGLQRLQSELLDEDTLLLAFSLGKNRSFLWAVDAESISSQILPSRQVIEKLAQELYGYLARSHSSLVKDRLEETASSLGEMLLRGVSSRLGSKRLLVAPDGVLHVIPFNILAPRRGAGPPQPLIVDHEIVNIPSVPVLGLLRQQGASRPAAPKAVAVWADPVFSASDERVQAPKAKQAGQASHPKNPSALQAFLLQQRSGDPDLRDLERLPASRQEAKAILSLVRAGESFRAFDFAASRGSVLSAPLDQFRILHFATHGLLYPITGISGVALSMVDRQGQRQDGFLPAQEIYSLQLNAELAVVSACKSALGRRVRGEGVVGLAQGFLYAGATRAVVSLWNVHDYATAILMEKFYFNMLRKGMKPAQALHQAQMEMRKVKHWARPYFWAGFILQGEWN